MLATSKVPVDFPETLTKLVREILRSQPDDIILFASNYFTKQLHPNLKEDAIVEIEAPILVQPQEVSVSSNEKHDRIKECSKNNPLISKLDNVKFNQLVSVLTEVTISTDETVLTQGQESSQYYIVESGGFEVIVDGEKLQEVIGSGGSFGEVLKGQVEKATIICSSEAIVFTLKRQDFDMFF